MAITAVLTSSTSRAFFESRFNNGFFLVELNNYEKKLAHNLVRKSFYRDKKQKNGLISPEAIERIKKFGRNVLPQEKPYSKIRLFLSQFNSPLMYILLTTVIISSSLKHYSDAIFIVVVLLINTTVGFYQKNKANQSLLALRKMVKVRTKVLRDGYEKEINSEELVVGDVVFLKSGDKVPADGRIIEARGLKINEANLTGESQAVEKKTDDIVPESASLPERTNMVFMGTIVEEGQATIVIVATGINTQIGEVVSLLKETKERKTPLQQKIATLSVWLSVFILSLIAIIIIEGYFTEKNFIDIFIAALALAFMMAVTGLSFPEFLILKKVMKAKLILIFATIIGVGIIFTGYLFNWIL